jgi:hypothetical protein
MEAKGAAALKLGISHLFHIFDSWENVEDYKQLFTAFPLPGFRGTYLADIAKKMLTFGKQMRNLGGLDFRALGTILCTLVIFSSFAHITRVIGKIPTKFPVNDEVLQGLLRTGQTLDSEIQANRFASLSISSSHLSEFTLSISH